MSKRDKQILNTLILIADLGKGDATAGELSRWTEIPKTTIRRRIVALQKLGLVLGDYHTRNYGQALYYSASYKLLMLGKV